MSKKEFHGSFTIGAGGAYSVKIDNILSQEEFDSLSEGDAHSYLFGEITYDDVFGNNWETDYCLRVGNFGTDRILIFQYGEGNKAT